MNYFTQPQQTIKKYSKSEIIEAIQIYCFQMTNSQVSSVVRLEDFENTLRHSCVYTGVTFLPQYIWKVPSEYGVVEVPYFFCPLCGKLYVYNHIYD